jgi:hypothetical protein
MLKQTVGLKPESPRKTKQAAQIKVSVPLVSERCIILTLTDQNENERVGGKEIER